MYDHRDVLFIENKDSKYQVLVCDSSSSVGSKELDIIRVDPYIVGCMAMRVCLFELLTIGAELTGLSLTLGCEWNSTGKQVYKGCKNELQKFGRENVPYVMSTEKNFPTKQTSIGITLTGYISKNGIKISPAIDGDFVYILGEPFVGDEVIEHIDDLFDYHECWKILNSDICKEIVPVGSKGIKGELRDLLRSYNQQIIYNDNITVDLNKSGGPSTCSICITSELLTDKTLEKKSLLIGRIKDKER
ncbi:hypothetical protein [Spirochaeta cellobiosiphila]|uniref:hypothetical protein n=1 Tax=Spirochaeta cellobiosiphila TaxID=504483 RepID=UPI00041928AB|nr:hypothetical protein [Spirochaeta cellobiosiphila]